MNEWINWAKSFVCFQSISVLKKKRDRQTDVQTPLLSGVAAFKKLKPNNDAAESENEWINKLISLYDFLEHFWAISAWLMDRRTDRHTNPIIEMRGRIKQGRIHGAISRVLLGRNSNASFSSSVIEIIEKNWMTDRRTNGPTKRTIESRTRD